MALCQICYIFTYYDVNIEEQQENTLNVRTVVVQVHLTTECQPREIVSDFLLLVATIVVIADISYNGNDRNVLKNETV